MNTCNPVNFCFRKLFVICIISLLLINCSSDGGSDSPPPVNQVPAADAGSNQRIILGSLDVALDGASSADPDGSTLTFSWIITTAPQGSTASLRNANTATPTFTPDLAGLYVLQLTVSDGKASATDEVELDVAVNSNPVANAGTDQDVNFGVTVTLNGLASIDPDGQTLTYTWSQVLGYGPDITGGSGTLIGANPSFTVPAQATTILLDLRVNDGFGDSFADRVQINVFKNTAKAIFVSTTGDDTKAGTRNEPKQTLQAAITAAQLLNIGDVYLALGTYTGGTLTLVNGVSVFGGYDSTNYWTRRHRVSDRSVYSSSTPVAISASNVTSSTSLDQLSVSASAASSAGSSSYGVLAVSSSGLTISNSRIAAANGANGTDGNKQTTIAVNGGDGSLGVAGCENSSSPLCDACSRPTPGSGGTGYAGRSGGTGGYPGLGSNSGAAGSPGSLSGAAGGPGISHGLGNWNPTSNYWGNNGADGINGVNGSAGGGSYTLNGYAAAMGANGGAGSPGQAGGGGGGGGGGDNDCDSYGSAGGGGGGAGGPGYGGYGGYSAGGSFSLYLWNSNVTIDASELVTGNGGRGGAGSPGQSGGLGGPGARIGDSGLGSPYGGSGEQDDGSNGARGGNGGAGGNGGHGGGGAGGPSIGILLGNSSLPQVNNVTYTIGAAGAGGTSSGNSGAAGTRANMRTP